MARSILGSIVGSMRRLVAPVMNVGYIDPDTWKLGHRLDHVIF